MLKLKIFLLSLGIYLLVFPSLLFADETLTITTYYPSPYGSYRQLSADQIAIGSGYRNPTYADGTLYVSGNVGIGTVGPSNKLEVAPANGALDFTQGIRVNTNSNPTDFTVGRGGGLIMQNADVITAGMFGIREVNSWNGALIFYTHNGTAGNTFGSTFLERIRIDSSGNVGIGTGAPSGLLHLYSNAPFLKLEASVGTNYVQQDFVNTGGSLRLGLENSAGGGLLTGTSAYAGVFGHTGAYPLQFSTNNVVRMTILSSGNVGIGTAVPQQPLHVHITSSGKGISLGQYNSLSAGQFAFVGQTGIDGTWNGGNIIGGDNGVAGMAIIHNSAGLGNSADVAFYTHYNGYQSSEKMRINYAGNVGIGTVSPGAGLEVNSAATDVVSFHNAVGTGLKLVGGQTTWTVLSDARLKDTLGSIKDATQKLLSIRPVYYRLKVDKKNTPHRVGLIAQDVQKVFPEVVDVDAKGYLGLRYTELTPLLIAGFQEQESRIEGQEKRIQKYEKEIEYLKQELIGSTAMLIESNKNLKANTKEIQDLKAEIVSLEKKL